MRTSPRDASDFDHVETEANDHNRCPAGDGICRYRGHGGGGGGGDRPKFPSVSVNEPAAIGGCTAELEHANRYRICAVVQVHTDSAVKRLNGRWVVEAISTRWTTTGVCYALPDAVYCRLSGETHPGVS